MIIIVKVKKKPLAGSVITWSPWLFPGSGVNIVFFTSSTKAGVRWDVPLCRHPGMRVTTSSFCCCNLECSEMQGANSWRVVHQTQDVPPRCLYFCVFPWRLSPWYPGVLGTAAIFWKRITELGGSSLLGSEASPGEMRPVDRGVVKARSGSASSETSRSQGCGRVTSSRSS